MNYINNKWLLIVGILCFMVGELSSQILPPTCTPSPGAFTQKPCLNVNDVVTNASFCQGDTYSWNNSNYTSAGTYTVAATDQNGCDFNQILNLSLDVSGCTDPLATNYNPSAVCDDGSCMAVQLGCICGETWQDSNFNSVQDAGEQFFSGLDVDLFDDQATLIGSTVTDAAGSYCFLNLPDGNYIVSFDRPRGAFFTNKDIGGNDMVDSDANTQTGFTDLIVISNGTCNTNTDAGFNFAD